MMASNCITKFSRNLAFGAALVAGLTLSATKEADAQTTTEGSLIALQAPFTTQFETGPGQLVRFNITRDSGNNNMRLYAIFYDNGRYGGFLRSDSAGAPSQTVRLQNAGSVSFVYLLEAAGASETTDTIPAGRSGLLITPLDGTSSGAAGVGLAALSLPAAQAYTVAGALPSEIRTIAGVAAVANAAVPIGEYAGPVLQSAQTQSTASGEGVDVKLTFNAELDQVGGTNTTIFTSGQVAIITNPLSSTALVGTFATKVPTIPRDPVNTTDAVVAGEKAIRIDQDGAAFTNGLRTVEVLSVADCTDTNGEDLIRDRAGNCAMAAEVDVETFGVPAFAGHMADVIANGGTCVVSQEEIAAFHGNGQPCESDDTLVLTATLAENLDASGIDHINDIDLVTAQVPQL